MADDNQITGKIVVDTADAQAALTQFAAQLQQTQAKMQEGFGKIGDASKGGSQAIQDSSKVKDLAKEVSGYDVEIPVDSMDEALVDLKEVLKENATKPASKEQTAAEAAMKAGKISRKQYDKLAEKHEWA